jgi:hypothetical protein
MVALTAPGATTPIPIAPAAWSPAPATTGVPAAKPVAAAASAETFPQMSGDSNNVGSKDESSSTACKTSFDHWRRETSSEIR